MLPVLRGEIAIGNRAVLRFALRKKTPARFGAGVQVESEVKGGRLSSLL
jgi:hypothetical protein